MPAESRVSWGGSLHQTFRILPEPSSNLRPFLEADGMSPEDVLENLPYDRARARDSTRTSPDPKRYRDGKQVYQTAGLLYESDERIHVTALGKATLRWLDIINPQNVAILGRHAAYALAACQLRNPTGAGRRYDESFKVFPFVFIWRSMLALSGRINSDELNRAIFKVRNETDLQTAINRIAAAREADDPNIMGEETITGERKDDRIIPWMSIASFGWTIISDKRGSEAGGYYEIPSRTFNIVKEASRVRHRHQEFGSVQEYVEHISYAAALPQDLR